MLEDDEHEYEFASEVPLQEKMSEWMQHLREYECMAGSNVNKERKKPDWRDFAKRLNERQTRRSRDFVCWQAQDVKMYQHGLSQSRLPSVPERPFHGVPREGRIEKENQSVNTVKDASRDAKELSSARVAATERELPKVTASTQTVTVVKQLSMKELAKNRGATVAYIKDVQCPLLNSSGVDNKLAKGERRQLPRLAGLRNVAYQLECFEEAGLVEVEELITELRKQQMAYHEQLLARSISTGKHMEVPPISKLNKRRSKAKAKPKVFFAGGNSNSSNVHVKASIKRKQNEPKVTVGRDAVGLNQWKGSEFVLDLLEELIARLRVKICFAMFKLSYYKGLKRVELVVDRELQITAAEAATFFAKLKAHYASRAWLRERCKTKQVRVKEKQYMYYFQQWRRQCEVQVLARGKALNAHLFRDQILRWRFFSCWRASIYLDLYNRYCSTSVLLWRRITVQGLAFHGWSSIVQRAAGSRERLCAAIKGVSLPSIQTSLSPYCAMRDSRQEKMAKFVSFRQQLEVSGRDTIRTLKIVVGQQEPTVRALYNIETTSQLAQRHKHCVSSWKLLARARTSKELRRLFHPSNVRTAAHLKFKAEVHFPVDLAISLPRMVRSIRYFLAVHTGQTITRDTPKATTQDLAVLLHTKKVYEYTFMWWKSLVRHRRARRQYECTLAKRSLSALASHGRSSLRRKKAILKVCNSLVYKQVFVAWQSYVEHWKMRYLAGTFSPFNRWKRYTRLTKRIKQMGKLSLARRYFTKLRTWQEKQALLRRVFTLYEQRAIAREKFLENRYAAEFNTLLRLFGTWKEETDLLVAAREARAGDIAAQTFYEQGLLRKAFNELVEGCGKGYFGPTSWR